MSYIPFPIGTIRGPYYTSNNQVQYMVNGQNGWVPISRHFKYEKEAVEICKELSINIINEYNDH